MYNVVDKRFVEDCFNNAPSEISLDQSAKQLRLDAFTEFRDLATPTTYDEDWRFTDLSSIYKKQFSPPTTNQNDNRIARRFYRDDTGYRLVFINGVFPICRIFRILQVFVSLLVHCKI